MLAAIAYYCVYISWITTGAGVVQKQPCNCIATYYLYRTWHGMHGYMGTCICILTTNNSYLPVIGVHEMHGRMHPNYWQITILLVVDPCSSLAYFMMTQPLPLAGKLPIKTLVAKQLPTKEHTMPDSYNFKNVTTVTGDEAILLYYMHLAI